MVQFWEVHFWVRTILSPLLILVFLRLTSISTVFASSAFVSWIACVFLLANFLPAKRVRISLFASHSLARSLCVCVYWRVNVRVFSICCHFLIFFHIDFLDVHTHTYTRTLHFTSMYIHIINRPQSVLCVMKIYIIFEINLCLECYFVRLALSYIQAKTLSLSLSHTHTLFHSYTFIKRLVFWRFTILLILSPMLSFTNVTPPT